MADESDDAEHGRRICNEFVNNGKRSASAIRTEIVQAAWNFLGERLDPEQDAVLTTIKDLLTSETCHAFVQNGLLLCKRLFPGEEGKFADEACSQWNIISSVPSLPEGSDLGCAMSVRVKQLVPVTSGLI